MLFTHAHWWLLLGHGSFDTVVLFCTRLFLIFQRVCMLGVDGWVVHTPWCPCGDRGQLGEPGSRLLPRGSWETKPKWLRAEPCYWPVIFPCCLRQGHINPGRFQTWYVTKDDTVLLVLVFLLPRCWDDRHAPLGSPRQVCSIINTITVNCVNPYLEYYFDLMHLPLIFTKLTASGWVIIFIFLNQCYGASILH